MAIGRITGQMLFPNLERQGVDLQVDTDLAYFDVNSRRLGIATQLPTQTLDVNGNAHIANLSILGNTITSDTGKIGLGTAANIVITGGTSYDILYTDGNGNLAFGNLNSLATQDFFTGNNIALGTNTAGQLVSNAITFLTTTSVTDAIARINNLLGNISNPSGSTLTTGNLYITSGVPSTNYQTGAIQVEGGVGINGNLYVSGNINTTAGNLTILNSAFFVGNAETGFGAIYAGIPTGYTVLPQLVAQFSANYNGYAQINNQNINSGQFASSDFVATADNGTDTANFVDLGIASSTYNYPAFSAIRPNDSYLYGNGGNLNLITDTIGKNINFVVGGGNLEHIAVQINHPNTTSTSANTGTLVVVGDTGVSGNLNIGANLYSNSASFGSINNTPIGNATPSTGTFTYLKATVGFSTANAVISGGELTALSNVYSTVGYFTNLSSGNVLLSGGNITGLTEFTATTGYITNFSTANSQITGGNITGLTDFTATTGYITNFGSSNVQLTGGNVGGITDFTATTGYITNFGSSNILVTGGSLSNVDVQANNFSSGNILVTGGYLSGLANISATLGTFTTGNINTLNVTTGNIVNLTVGNLTSGNVSAEFYGNIHTDYIFSQSGNIDIVPVNNGLVTIDSNSSFIIPVGPSEDRPVTGQAGQIRFNTTYGSLEYFTGIDWSLVSNQLEDMTIDYADGVQTVFTLDQASTASALLVSINGTLQIPSGPTPAYTVSGDQITFAQAPLASDIINIRFIASTTVPDLTGFSGNIATRGTTDPVNFGNGVNYAYNTCPTFINSHFISSVSTGDTLLDSFSANDYRTGKYVISSTNILGFEYQTDEVIVVHNGTTAKITVYGTTHTGATPIMNFSANIVSGNVIIYGNGVSSGNSVKLTKTLISI